MPVFEFNPMPRNKRPQYSTTTDYSADYAANYLKNPMSIEELQTSPIVNQENAVVQKMENPTPVVTDIVNDGEKDDSNIGFLKAQGIDTERMYNEYMEGAPEYVSEEDQERRLRTARTSKTIADLGSLASAFANLYSVSNGAYNQQVAYTEQPKYQDYIDRWTAQRNAYKRYAASGRDYVYNKQRQTIKDKYDMETAALSNQIKLANLELSQAKSTREQELATMRMQDLLNKQANSDKTFELRYKQLEEQMNHNRKMEGIAATNAAASMVRANNAANGGSKRKNDWVIQNPDGSSITVPIDRINDYNRAQLLRLTGSDGYKTVNTDEPDTNKTNEINKGRKKEDKIIVYQTKQVKMSKDEIWNYIANNMTPEAERYIQQLGGQVTKAAPAQEQHKEEEVKYIAADGTRYKTAAEAKAHNDAKAKEKASKDAAKQAQKQASTSNAQASKNASKQASKVKVAKTVNGIDYDEQGREIINWY